MGFCITGWYMKLLPQHRNAFIPSTRREWKHWSWRWIYKERTTVAFLRNILLRIGLDMKNIEWIMACVCTIQYVVIINGYPTKIFGAWRALRRDCSLSPLLFILVMDGLSHNIKAAIMENLCTGLTLGHGIKVTQFFCWWHPNFWNSFQVAMDRATPHLL